MHGDDVSLKATEALCTTDAEELSVDSRNALLQADWGIVEKGWNAHVLGDAPHKFKDAKTAVTSLRVNETSHCSIRAPKC